MIQRNKKGFSLVEMLVVIAIIAVLVAVVTPIVTTATTKAAAATNAANLRATKGAFATVNQMNENEYKQYTTGVKALTGDIATDSEQFVVSSEKGLTVAALHAVAMNDTGSGTKVEKGTHMTLRVNDDGTIRVTYNGLPIAYFAEVAEKGTANPLDYQSDDDFRSQVAQNYMGQLQNMFNGTFDIVKDNMNDIIDSYIDRKYEQGNWKSDIKWGLVETALTLRNYSEEELMNIAFGESIGQIQDIINNPQNYGDCMECAINNVNTTPVDIGNMSSNEITAIIKGAELEGGGIMGGTVGSFVGGMSDYNPNGSKYCAGYEPISATNKNCKNCDPSHGISAHFSAEGGMIDSVISNTEKCTNGSTHDYDKNHKCTVCNHQSSIAPHNYDTSNMFMNGICSVCGACKCCEEGTYKTVESYGVDIGVCANTSGTGCSHARGNHTGYSN